MKEVGFRDILLARGTACGIFKYMTRSWDPKQTMLLEKHNSPEELKDIVIKSVFIDSVIEVESLRLGVRKETLKKEVFGYLEEMGMDKKLHVIRWMGVVFLKISFMMKIGVFVNEAAMLKVRDAMGNNPVLFLPTHRSYADFCLITYLCYNYDIDFPAVAAGMDFYSMAVVGRRMRETGAFYIRRSLVGAPLYAATLKQYVRTLVAKHAAPVEFFLEGTRSRSNKSIPPKYGMLAMSLLSYFSREVSDVTIVPFNISYDRLMEHGLFAYEHLGVPKPKESTGGLLKSLHALNDHFGNIYMNAGAPISVKDYLKETAVLSEESLKPCDLQQLTPAQFEQVQDLANYVVGQQQANTVATISNLMALVLMQSVMKGESLHLDEVLVEVTWIVQVLRSLGASVFEKDVRSSVDRIMVVHNKMMTFDKEIKLRLVSSALMDVSPEVQKKMKGHVLKAETMVNAVPIIQLQLYVNPVLHYLVPPAIVYLLVKRAPLDIDQLLADYRQVRTLLKHEFFYIDKEENTIFNKAVDYCLENNVIEKNGETLSTGINDRLQYLFEWSVLPALTTLMKCASVMDELSSCEHKSVQKQIQERVESSHCHPYCLSLEAIGNCLQGLVLHGAIAKDKREKDIQYKVVPDIMKKSLKLINTLLPELKVDFSGDNKVILNPKIASRL